MPVIPIDQLDDPRIGVYRDIRRPRPTNGSFVVESKLAVERALQSSFGIESVLTDARFLEQLPAEVLDRTPVFAAGRELINQIVGFEFHRGMLACVQRQPNPTLDSVARGGDTLVVCPQITDPTNLAGIIRNCTAFGVAGLVLGSHCTDAFSRRVVRVSMGSLFRLPVRTSEDLEYDLRQLRERWGWELVATVLDGSVECLPTSGRSPKTALLFGNEGPGLETRWTRLCTRQVTLPMQQDTDSLNVAAASGIFLYHYTCVAPPSAEPPSAEPPSAEPP